MQFKDLGLDNRLLKNLAHQNIKKPTEIQRKAVPVAMAGKDILASSKTGSGKTLAFVLPMLHKSLKSKSFSKNDPRAVILAPTRELAKQVYNHLRSMLGGLSYDATLITGGENFNDQVNALRKFPKFIVATPGRLADHLEHQSLFLNGLETLILDEADRMLDLGFAEHLQKIHKAANHRRRQTLMFSATLDHDAVTQFAGNMLDNPKFVSVGLSTDEHTDITQSFYLCDHLDHKQALLDKIIETEKYFQIMIFTATRADTDRLTTLLNERKLKAVALSGDMNQTARNNIMSQFERRAHKILVTTDVASRGLDLTSVTHVINFDMPKHMEEYVHRVGRTGRAGKKGHAVSFVSREEELTVVQVETLIQQRIHRVVQAGYEPKSRDAYIEKVNTKAGFRDRKGRTNNATNVNQDQASAERRMRLKNVIQKKAGITKLKK